MPREPLKVGISGVRGVVGRSMTPQIAAGWAEAFGNFVGKGPVLVGRDTRPTGEMVELAVIAGLQSVGCTPVLAGIVPTPTLLLQTATQDVMGGICITASHNPAEWNALKFIGRDGMFLDLMHSEELFDMFRQQNFRYVAEADLPIIRKLEDPLEVHWEKIRAYVDIDLIRAQGFKVAVDCCNGVGALSAVPFLRDELGCEVFPIHDAPNGRFERGAEPTPDHLTALCETTKDNGCQIGFAQDPDGDRLAIVSEQGEAIGEDYTLVFAAQQVLERHKQGPIVVNLSCGKLFEHVAKQHDVPVYRTKIGEIHVSTRMLREGSVIGGEPNGGVIIPEIHPCRDSYGGMAIILERLAHQQKTITELRDELPTYVISKKKMEIRSGEAPRLLRALRRRYEDKEINLLDGVHIDFGDHWVHVRASNTEPVMRVVAEAPSLAQADGLTEELIAFLSAPA